MVVAPNVNGRELTMQPTETYGPQATGSCIPVSSGAHTPLTEDSCILPEITP